MMKKLVFILCAFAFCFNGIQAKKKTVQKPISFELATEADSASYALGVNMGSQIATNLTKDGYRLDIFAQGFNAALFSAPTKISVDSAEIFLNNYMRKMEEAATKFKIKEQEIFLAENKKREGVKETESGLQYLIVKLGTGEKPTATDKVKVNYEGSLLNGTKFDSSIDRGEPLVMQLNRVISGWQEGVQLMPVGSKFVFYIPYELAYGKQGAGQVIPPYSTLIFEVELLEIVK